MGKGLLRNIQLPSLGPDLQLPLVHCANWASPFSISSLWVGGWVTSTWKKQVCISGTDCTGRTRARPFTQAKITLTSEQIMPETTPYHVYPVKKMRYLGYLPGKIISRVRGHSVCLDLTGFISNIWPDMTAGSGPTWSGSWWTPGEGRHELLAEGRPQQAVVLLGPPASVPELATSHAASCLHKGTVGPGRTES